MEWTVDDYVRLAGAVGVVGLGLYAAYEGRWDVAAGILVGAYGGVSLPTTKVAKAVKPDVQTQNGP